MARGKKKETLTPEERLQAALVPESEQPYPVPGNWCWIHLLDSFYNYTDSKKKIPQKEYIKDGDIAVVDQGQDLVGGYTNDRELAFSGNLPVIIFGDHTRCIKYIDFPFAQGADGVKVLKPKPFFDAKAFYYAFQNVNIPNMGYRRHFPLFDQYTIPLPPLAEQQRIIDRIESLFAKLDEAKQKAQDALDSFETRKAAILHKAFTGELTAQWRKEHGIGMESWEQIQFSELTSDVRLGLVRSKAEQSYESLHPYLKMNNITSDGTIDIADIVNIDATEDEVELFALQYGDFLFNTRNSYELVGKNAVWNIDSQNKVLFNNNIMRVRFKHGINPFLVSFYLNSKEGKLELDKCKKNTTNIAAIYAKNLNQIQIPIMSKDEQTEIVRILDVILAKEQQAKEAAEGVLEQIDLIKKAILARAFRGELGTNNPSEESAVKLLKTCYCGELQS